MAYQEFSIGEFSFMNLAGQPQFAQELVELLHRPGVDGTRKRLLGLRADPFQLRGSATVQDMQAGIELAQAYHDAAADEPLEFVWQSIDFSDLDLRVRVLKVRMLPLRVMACMVGNVGNGHTCVLESLWDLQIVPAEPEPEPEPEP